MVDFLPSLVAEIEALEADLGRDIRFIKLQELKRVKALYDPEHLPVDLSAFANATAQANRSPRKTNPERDKALTTARMYVANRTGPVPTNDVLHHLGSLGIEISGAEPRNNLSAMMSNSGLFTSNGRKGWTIREAGDPAERDEEAEDALNDFMTATSPPRRAPVPPPMARSREVIDDDIPF